MNIKKINRNDPCPCGSGKKYKQCCQATLEAQKSDLNARVREHVPDLFKQAIKYQKSGNLEKAEEIYNLILSVSPKHVSSLYNLGLLACDTKRFEIAVELLRKAVRITPSADSYCSLAIALKGTSNTEEAIECLRKAVSLNPADAIVCNNLGSMLLNARLYEEGILYLQKALVLNPNEAEIINNIASCLVRLGKLKEAVPYFRRVTQINPHIAVFQNLLYCLYFDGYSFPQAYLEEAQYFEKFLYAHAVPYTTWHHTQDDQITLRIGFVSGDFKNHPVGYFLESLTNAIDRSKIEFFAYSSQHYEDELTARIKPNFHQWINITSLDDQLAAQKIHGDGIHILIDLAGHTSNNRLSLFSWKPAPVQVSWLGYFASTGMTFIDYFLADPISVPEQNRSHFTEEVWYLPKTRLCFTPPSPDIAQEPTLLPALNNGFVTFGCFQTISKITDQILALWAKILHRCQNSQLLIKNHQIKDAVSKQDFIAQLKRHQISLERIVFEEGSPRQEYLAAYGRVDFILDTFPFTGGTTTCEALWMGVPTLTLAGNTLLERQGMSLLSCVGLESWIATNEEDYINKAVHYANHLDKLAQLRSQLRQKMLASPLTDAPLFAADLTHALQEMWQKHMQK